MIKLILLIIIAICVKTIYDARSIAKKYFSTSDINKQIKLLKIVGFIIAIICFLCGLAIFRKLEKGFAEEV